MTEFVLLMFTLLGFTMMAISIPLAWHMVPPNMWYGFRVRQTLEDPEIWYRVNEHSGKRLLIAGLVFTLSAWLLYPILGASLDAYGLACVLISVVTTSIAIGSSFRYLRSISK